MHNEREFLTAVLPGGFHIVETPITSLQDIKNGMWLTTSVPIPADKPWYYDLADTPEETDEFTAWTYTACIRANVSPMNTGAEAAHRVLSFLVKDLIEFKGLSDETVNAIYAITAVIVGGAAHIREHGFAPVDASAFVDGWLDERSDYGGPHKETSWD